MVLEKMIACESSSAVRAQGTRLLREHEPAGASHRSYSGYIHAQYSAGYGVVKREGSHLEGLTVSERVPVGSRAFMLRGYSRFN